MVTRDLQEKLDRWGKKDPWVPKERAVCLVYPVLQAPLVREVPQETSHKSSDLLELRDPRERLEIL